MDPLSITAGIIAILGAATTTTSTISKLRAAGKAPELFDELSNEVEALRSVLIIIRACLRRVQHSEIEQEVHDMLGGLLRNTQNVALEMQLVLEYQLRTGEGRTKDGRTKVNRRDWMKYGPEVERTKQKIRDARDNLHTGLTAVNVIQGEMTRQLVVQIQGIHISQRAHFPTALSPSQQQTLANHDASDQFSQMVHYSRPGTTNQTPLPTHTTQLARQTRTASTSAIPIPENQDQSSILVPSNDLDLNFPYAQSSPLDTMTITATIARRRCHVSCDCACHVRTAGCTPGWLKGVIGQLMFNYTQAIYTRPCTKDSCLKASHKSSFSYHFPSWLAWKTLEFQHYSSGLASYGSTWSLRVNVDITHRDLGSQFLAAIGNTNTEAIRESITSGLIHSRMLFRGVPLLLYAYDFISREGYTYSHQRTYVPPDPLCNLLRRAGFAVTLDGHAEPRIYGEFVVQHLKGLGVGADDLADYLQFTAIHCATVLPEGGDASASDIIDNNVRDIDTPDAMGRTPLHWACATGSLDFVQALLEVNALPNSRDWAGMRPLHHACEGLAEVDSRPRVAVSETLLAYGADVNAVDEDGQTPLHQARDAETSQHLLDHDACVDALDKFGHTPLFYARDAAQVDVLIKHGAHLDHITNNGDAAIHLCSLLGRGGAVAALARHGANLYATTNRGKTPFHCAILVNSDQTLLALREANERDPRRDYPIYNNLGENYLHIAAYHADARTMAELLLFDLTGHHPDARESYGLTAEDVFRMYDGETCWERPGFSARNERRKVWEALVKKAREQNKDWRIEELDGDDDHFYDDAIEETYPMPGSFDTAWSK